MGHLGCGARAGGQAGDEAEGDGGGGSLGPEPDGQGEQGLGSAVLHQGDELMTNLVTFVFFVYFSFPVIPGLHVATVTFDFDHFNFVDL